ncbi:MAG: class I SAM-dependent methyltransferase [Desulfosarcinaceae bacterium]|nr:class I SAM-dependent methyltransferase [Desulfosarcinaceae bacterium]
MLPDDTLLTATKGFLDPEEGEALYTCAREMAEWGPCLEIGSYCGKSALYLGAACKAADGVLFSIDHHRGSEEQQPGEGYFDAELYDFKAFQIDTLPFFRRTLAAAELTETVVPIVCASEVAVRGWQTPLALLFIDGGHAYETVRTDYRLWHPHIMPGGRLLFHDLFEDPAAGGQAPWEVYQEALNSGRFRPIGRVKSLGILECSPSI